MKQRYNSKKTTRTRSQRRFRWVSAIGGFLLIGALLIPNIAHAQTITTQQDFSFGRFALLDFANVEQIEIASNGNVVKSADIFFIDDPQVGLYNVSEAPAGTNYTVTVPSGEINVAGLLGRSMVVDNLGTGPDNKVTDANGEATFWIYGRLRTRGDMSYPDQTLTGNIEIDLVFNN